MLTLAEAKDWLRLEQGDTSEDALLQAILVAVDEYIRNAVPAGMVLEGNPIADLLARVLVADWYEHREAIGQVRDDLRPTVRALVAQLQHAYPVITTARLPDAVVGRPYCAALSADGGARPYTWSIASGSLPVGLVLDPDTGEVIGTPTAEGTSTMTVQLTDSSTPPKATSRAVALRVVAA